jgi:hypothetical protein
VAGSGNGEVERWLYLVMGRLSGGRSGNGEVERWLDLVKGRFSGGWIW